MTFRFKTKAQADKFQKCLLRHFILTEKMSDYVIAVYDWSTAKNEYMESANRRACAIYDALILNKEIDDLAISQIA
jgi:hypothetical protein